MNFVPSVGVAGRLLFECGYYISEHLNKKLTNSPSSAGVK